MVLFHNGSCQLLQPFGVCYFCKAINIAGRSPLHIAEHPDASLCKQRHVVGADLDSKMACPSSINCYLQGVILDFINRVTGKIHGHEREKSFNFHLCVL